MSELVVFKANELAVSRYDLTEHETKLILCCVSLLNPTIEKPQRADRTITFTYQQYAEIMGISRENAYGALAKATRNLMTRTVEIQDPLVNGFEIFQWTNYAKFSSEKLELVFSEEILPYLFQLKKFIKYNLEHVKSFENKYSMRVYEWLLKELTQRKTYKANIEISINEFKFMMMIEKKYKEFKTLNRDVLKQVNNDINTHSDMRLVIEKSGRPANTLIFQVELDQQMDLVKELSHDEVKRTKKIIKDQESVGNDLHDELQKTLIAAEQMQIHLSAFENQFLIDMDSKYKLNGSFSWLTPKQRTTLVNILTKYKK
ncbi:MAG: replication initiation protein [Acinetobacter sp.]|nr:replication initiation protein [Acinetobacter sp.]